MKATSQDNKLLSILIEVIGWIGMASLLGAYILASFGLIAATGMLFQLLNLFGALFLMVGGIKHRYYQSVAVNGIWSIIGLFAIIQLLLRH